MSSPSRNVCLLNSSEWSQRFTSPLVHCRFDDPLHMKFIRIVQVLCWSGYSTPVISCVLFSMLSFSLRTAWNITTWTVSVWPTHRKVIIVSDWIGAWMHTLDPFHVIIDEPCRPPTVSAFCLIVRGDVKQLRTNVRPTSRRCDCYVKYQQSCWGCTVYGGFQSCWSTFVKNALTTRLRYHSNFVFC